MYRNPSNFTIRSDVFAHATRQVVGTGVTGLKGDEWRWRKTALLKEFHRNKMLADERGLIDIVLEEGLSLCKELERAADPCSPILADQLTTKAAAELKLKKAQESIDKVVRGELDLLLEESAGHKSIHPDRKDGSVMASLIINESKFRVGGKESMLAEARVFVQAGFETTAQSLAFAMGMMAEPPDLADKMAKEGTIALTEEFGGDPQGNLELLKTALENTSFVQNFFLEGLRLYPLAPALGGECTSNIGIVAKDGTKYSLPKGTETVFLNMPPQRQVANPDEICLQRWDFPSTEKPFLHTFQHGPHSCPGKPLSLLEGHIFLLLIASEFRFEFPNNDSSKVQFDDNGLLRPKDSMPLLVKRRNE